MLKFGPAVAPRLRPRRFVNSFPVSAMVASLLLVIVFHRPLDEVIALVELGLEAITDLRQRILR